MDGILLIDKPIGWTSHDVVSKVRSVLKNETGQKVKVGHTGTLDPFATGLLILVVGSYTKKAAEFSKLDKTYEAELTLGSVSTSGDTEGEITQKSVKKPPKQDVEDVLSGFVGEIEHIPHAYSAIKIGGQRAYKLARQGKDVKLEPRQVKVHTLQVADYKYPSLKIVAEVSSGTYIRSLAEDIGEKLGTGAYLSALRRTSIGEFDIIDSLRLDEIDSTKLANVTLNGTYKREP